MFSMAAFEHFLMPWKVTLEMTKLMFDNGTAFIITHAAWPLHEEPRDFFRFSTEAWHAIFNAYTGFKVLDTQYQHRASIVPQYLHFHHFAEMSLGPASRDADGARVGDRVRIRGYERP
jgi:hypothetical protein